MWRPGHGGSVRKAAPQNRSPPQCRRELPGDMPQIVWLNHRSVSPGKARRPSPSAGWSAVLWTLAPQGICKAEESISSSGPSLSELHQFKRPNPDPLELTLACESSLLLVFRQQLSPAIECFPANRRVLKTE